MGLVSPAYFAMTPFQRVHASPLSNFTGGFSSNVGYFLKSNEQSYLQITDGEVYYAKRLWSTSFFLFIHIPFSLLYQIVKSGTLRYRFDTYLKLAYYVLERIQMPILKHEDCIKRLS